MGMQALAASVLGQGLEGHTERTARALDAQRHGLPLCQVLGTVHRQSIGLYANINRGTIARTPQAFAQRAWAAAAAGRTGVAVPEGVSLGLGLANGAALAARIQYHHQRWAGARCSGSSGSRSAVRQLVHGDRLRRIRV